MEEERINLEPRLQQDAYLHHLAAAQPGFGANFTSAAGGYPLASARSSAFPYSVGNFSVVNESSSNDYAPFNESHGFAQGLPAAGIANRYHADSFNYPDTSRFDTNASPSAQSYAFSTGALELTHPTHAGYSGVLPATQYHSGPPSYNEHPFATDNASIGSNIFGTESTTHTNGHDIANNPVPMPVSNNRIPPLGMGLMTENQFALPPNVYNTGRASANYPFSMQGSEDPILPMDLGLMTGSPIPLPPNIYNTEQTSANNPFPMPTPNSALIPVDIGPPSEKRPSCTQCNKDFSRQSDLRRHAKKHQSGPKNIKCQVQDCKYSTYRSDKLREHVTRRHPAAGSRSN